METKRICPSCQKPIAADGPLGLCPECLAKSGLETEPSHPTQFPLPAVEEVARLFPQFEILGFLGRGGMGAVYHARQPKLDRQIALKILPAGAASDPGFAERFQREARALARLNHPNIVAIYDFGVVAELSFLVMEFVDGANLRELSRRHRCSPQQALQIVPQICDALQFAHNEGIVHRDIKPENILLDKKGRVKIADFGIAKIIGGQPEQVGLTGGRDVMGTPHYMAPEQLERPQEVDHRADIFALGVVFYELLTGELPLGRFAPPSRKVQVDVRLDEVVLRTLEKEPERRYQQAGHVKTAVDTIASSPRRIVAPAQPPRPGAWTAKQLAVAAIVIAGLFLAMGAIAILWKKTSSASQSHTTDRPSVPLRKTAESANTQAPDNDHVYVPPATPALGQILADLKSANATRRSIALNQLSQVPNSTPNPEIIPILTNLLMESSWASRAAAARALAVWGDSNAVPPLLEKLGDPEFSVRWAALDALARLKDARAIAPLAVLLSDESCSHRAEVALIGFGPAAEAATLTALAKQTGNDRRVMIRVLKAIGTTNSVPALVAVSREPDDLLAMLARDALKTIELRNRIQTSLQSKP